MKDYSTFLFFIQLTFQIANGKYATFTRNLPSTVVPLKYNITLKPNLNETYPVLDGNVVITILILEYTNSVTLHALNLQFDRQDVLLKDSDNNITKVSEIKMNYYTETCTIIFQNRLKRNQKYSLHINYSGWLRDDNQGFYLAKYRDEYGTERLFATTFFIKENARSAFPCFDELDKKAHFLIKIIRPENYTAISNEKKILTEYIGNGNYLDTFKETYNMSTYLVAFTLCQFEHTIKNGVHQIFAKPQAVKRGKTNYALKRSSELLGAVEDYFDMKYQFSKMDLVVFPDEYFSAEAMENWGHISYNERTLLFSNTTSTSINKQTTVTTMLHEFIHQWFGNLVTPSDWKYLWLSEGFATYLQFRIGDLVEPSWKLLDQFHTMVVERAFEGENTFYGTALNDVYQQEWVPYLKASSIIRMMENFLTPDVFRKGLQNYLKNNAYGIVNPSNLYASLQKAAENDSYCVGSHTITEIMNTWDSSISYPYVNVTRDYQNGYITFEQGMFMPELTLLSKKQHIWYIPINYIFNAVTDQDFINTKADFWLTAKTFLFNTTSVKNGWLIVNKQFSGYYRVNYDLTNWNRLISFLKGPHFYIIPPLTRAQLLSDTFEFAKRGSLSYTIPLNLSTYLSQERSYTVLATFFNALGFLNTCLSSSDLYLTFKNYIFNLLRNVLNYLGYNEKKNDTYLDKLSRISILNWLCSLGDIQCKQVALKRLRGWMINKTDFMLPDMQEALLCGALRMGSGEEWNFVFDKFKAEKDSTVRRRVLTALCCSEDEEIILMFLNEITNNKSDIFKDSERISAIISILESGSIGLRAGSDYIGEHFRKLWDMFDMQSILNIIGSRITTQHRYNELKALRDKYPKMQMVFKDGLTFAENNLKWKENNLSEIRNWLIATQSDVNLSCTIFP